jgi:hypothetical protein
VIVVYPVILAMALALGAVTGYVKQRFFEPALRCPAGSTDKRCVRMRKMVEGRSHQAEAPGEQPSLECR